MIIISRKNSNSKVKPNMLTVNGKIFIGFVDLGADLTKYFAAYYHQYFSIGKISIPVNLLTESKKVFSSWQSGAIGTNSDSYFNNFSFITEELIKTKQYYRAFELWMEILGFVKKWELVNGIKLHKGTPYYFCAVSCMLQHDFDTGLLAMSNAVKDDKENNSCWEAAPAYSFMSMNDQQIEQYFKPFVKKIINFIRKRLDTQPSSDYQHTRSGNLSYSNFRLKLLDNKLLSEDIRYYFVYSVIRIWHLRRLHKNALGDDIMAPIIFSNALLDLLLVLDELLKNWDNPSNNRKYIRQHYDKLAREEGWNLVTNLDVNKKRDLNFEVWITELIDGTYTNTSGVQVQRLEADFILSYGLRNFSAHNIKSQKIMWNNYTKILESIFSSLFKTIELI